MQHSKTFTDLDAAADFINTHRAAGTLVDVNGREVHRLSKAQVWGTGSLSVPVVPRKGNCFTDLWVKPGQSVAVRVRVVPADLSEFA